MGESDGPEPQRPLHDRTLMLVLAYLWVLALVPLLTSPDADVRWHARHGLVLTVAELAAFVAWTTALGVAWIMTGGLFGCVTTLQLLVTPLVGLLIVAFHAFLIVRALQGERVLVPRLSQLADRF